MNIKIPTPIISLFLINLVLCSQYSVAQESRTIILDFMGEELIFTEDESLSFESWECHEFMSTSTNVLVEVGIMSGPGNEAGFILYDGTNSGTFAAYERVGLEHSWAWTSDLSKDDSPIFTFVIDTKGDGIYYDFRGMESGESTPPREVYTCKK